AFRMSAPRRVVVDVSGARLAGVPEVLDVDTAIVGGIGATEFRDEASRVARVLVNLRADATYRVGAQGNDVVVTITGGARTASAAPAALEAAERGRREAEARAAQAEETARTATQAREQMDRQRRRLEEESQ